MRSSVSEKDTNIVQPPLRRPRLSFNAVNSQSSERSCPTSGNVMSFSWMFPTPDFDVPLISGTPQPSESSHSILDPEIPSLLIRESPLVPTGFPLSDLKSLSHRTAPLSLNEVSDVSSTCHWGRGPMETSDYIVNTLKTLVQFTQPFTTRYILGTFEM